MKRFVCLILILLLCLTACAGQNEAPMEETQPQETVGLYLPGSEAETLSGGALRQYVLPDSGYFRVCGVGGEVMLASAGEQTSLLALSGEQGSVVGNGVLPAGVDVTAGQQTYGGFAYFDSQARQAVYLDSQLKESLRIDLPEELQGSPAFSPDGAEIYYCVPGQLRAYDTQKGISRLIRSHAYQEQTLLGAYFEGRMVLCRVTDDQGAEALLYVSAVDGSTLGDNAGVDWLDTFEDTFFASRMDGITHQYLFGKEGQQVRQLLLTEESVIPATQLGSVIGATREGESWRLSCYSLESAQKVAAVSLPALGEIVSCYADRWTGGLWILMDDGQAQSLLHWKLSASPVTEETVYESPVYTADAPNEAGLEELQDRVNSLNRTHGVMIRIWKTAVKTDGGTALQPEYQTAAISGCLDQLEQTLSLFPESFLSRSVNTKLRICIVRSVGGEMVATRFWDDGDAFIVLSAGVDIRDEFLRAMGYIVDSHILGNSTMLDTWQGLNPEGFTYGGDTQAYTAYLEGENRAFVSVEAMGSLSEERAELFYQAMLPDNAQTFASPVMQEKLLLLCQSVRDAWRLERKTDVYTWEQYLSQPIAYSAS